MLFRSADDVHKTLCELKALGVLLAIDDFGTGFSSLSYLQRFPIDRLKIDQSFIRDIENRPANRSIVQAIVVLGKSLSLEVIAEGVESESELRAARESGCDEVQGYLYSPALSAEALWDWLDARDGSSKMEKAPLAAAANGAKAVRDAAVSLSG